MGGLHVSSRPNAFQGDEPGADEDWTPNLRVTFRPKNRNPPTKTAPNLIPGRPKEPISTYKSRMESFRHDMKLLLVHVKGD
jgi:hypothetical protein